MYKSLAVLFITTLSLTLLSGVAKTAEQAITSEEILWYRAYFPPVTIPSGADAERGFFDNIMNYIIENLPEYTHHRQTANFKRIINEMKKGGNSCCPSLYKTDAREKFISFSVPAVVVLPNGLITTKENKDKFEPYLNKEGKISLTSLLKNQGLTLGVSNGRVFSGGIDEVLQQYIGAKNIYARSGADVFKGLLSMLFLGRIDYTIGYPTEAKYFSQEQEEYKKYLFFPIEENSILFTLGYVGCPKTAWGHKVIQNVDEILLKNRDKEFFLSFYEEWLDDSTKPMYRSIINNYFESEKK